MKQYIERIGLNTLLLKITSLNGISVVLQILGGLITSKLIAIYLGERGMALLGHLRNFLMSVQTGGSLGFSSGIIALTAKNKENPTEITKILSTSTILSMVATMLISVSLFLGADYWNAIVFKSGQSFTYIFKCLAVALPFITLNTLLLSYINGLSRYKKVVWIHITTNLVGLLISIFLILNFKIKGAMIGLILSPAIALLITLGFFIRLKDTSFFNRIHKVYGSYLKSLSSYALMALFSAMVLPIVFIAIRQYIVELQGLDYAGYWDAMTRISDYYLKFVATLMTLYILPQLAKATTGAAFKKEIVDFYKTVLPLFGIGLLLIYFLRNPIIRLIYTEDFLPMEGIFKWQLLGDFLKVASIVIGYQIIAKNMLKLFLITEIISIALIYFTSTYFIKRFGFEGAAMGHCITYFVHLCMLLFIFRRPLLSKSQTIE